MIYANIQTSKVSNWATGMDGCESPSIFTDRDVISDYFHQSELNSTIQQYQPFCESGV